MDFTPILTLPTGGQVFVGYHMIPSLGVDVICETLARNVLKLSGYYGGGAACCVIDIGGQVSLTVDYTLGSESFVDISDILKGLFVRPASGTSMSNAFSISFTEYDSDGVFLGDGNFSVSVSDRESSFFSPSDLVKGCSFPHYDLPLVCWYGFLTVGVETFNKGVRSIDGYSAGVTTSTTILSQAGSLLIDDQYADEFRLVDSGGNVVGTVIVANLFPIFNFPLKWWGVRHGGWKKAVAEVLDYSVEASSVSDYERTFDARRGLDLSEGLRCRISGLDGYDYRYYSDLLIADEVYAGDTPVRVTGDTQPMRGGSMDLEFTVELLRDSNL